MPDNPKKKKLDGKRISQQSWEQAYQRRKKTIKKQHLTATNIAKQDSRRLHEPGILKGSAVLIVNNRKLESAISSIENAVSQDPARGKVPFDFCKEWQTKGKPIFNMMLLLFSFRGKVKNTITRMMNGIDEVSRVPAEVGDV